MAGTHLTFRTTGDPALDVLAASFADAFRRAESGCAEARAEIVEFFSPQILSILHARHLITWDPATAPLQMTLEV